MAIIGNQEKFYEYVLELVKQHNGMKWRDLVRICGASHDVDSQSMEEFIQHLVKEHKLIEVEYTMDMSTIGMFLLPPNSRVNIRGVPPSPPRRVV